MGENFFAIGFPDGNGSGVVVFDLVFNGERTGEVGKVGANIERTLVGIDESQREVRGCSCSGLGHESS